jgi:hypothetical protein
VEDIMSSFYSDRKLKKLAEHLQTNVEDLKTSLALHEVIDLVSTFDDIKWIYYWAPSRSKLKSAALTKMLAIATTFDEVEQVYVLVFMVSKFRIVAVRKKMSEIARKMIVDFMASYDPNAPHEHITDEEMVWLSAITSEEPSYADLDYIQSIDEKVESCDVCRRRYEFSVNFRAIFKSPIF